MPRQRTEALVRLRRQHVLLVRVMHPVAHEFLPARHVSASTRRHRGGSGHESVLAHVEDSATLAGPAPGDSRVGELLAEQHDVAGVALHAAHRHPLIPRRQLPVGMRRSLVRVAVRPRQAALQAAACGVSTGDESLGWAVTHEAAVSGADGRELARRRLKASLCVRMQTRTSGPRKVALRTMW